MKLKSVNYVGTKEGRLKQREKQGSGLVGRLSQQKTLVSKACRHEFDHQNPWGNAGHGGKYLFAVPALGIWRQEIPQARWSASVTERFRSARDLISKNKINSFSRDE